jgi:DMSO/TMAO reductase YedYZ molybdopterin-dependent catalytic subunit
MSRFNDKVQSWLFDPNQLAPTFAEKDITTPFPFNAFYSEDGTPEIDGDTWRLEVSGLVDDRTPWTLSRLRTLPQESQITRHICIEGWSATGQWSGVPFRTFLQRIGADTRARYVGFKCADRYYSSIDMATALHPQTILALDYGKDPPPAEYGFPLKLRVPTKLGFKTPKHIAVLFVTNEYPGWLVGRPGLQLVQRFLTLRRQHGTCGMRDLPAAELSTCAPETSGAAGTARPDHRDGERPCPILSEQAAESAPRTIILADGMTDMGAEPP